MNLKPNFFESKNNNGETRFNHEESGVSSKLASELLEMLPKGIHSRPIVFVCIGTDRSTGDSLGPLVGTLLSDKSISSFHIYGTLDNPIHAVNLEEKLNEIMNLHFNPFIIGIDACLGRLKSVGYIQLGEGPVKPGAGVNKELPSVGNIHITGIVNVSGFMEFFVLQNTRLSLVLNMAKAIANGIYKANLMYKPKQGWSNLNIDWDQEKIT
ncbi:spore protease YyaC [Bacillus massilinigeriensis]|uniref:spore protease YyaC n=1 Tax=Bacillus massilionigeriensis TaxID=1805475 RepID=UPI00096B4DA4|nr:spore protease YyaC [Bacillus massilionigeriensis]